MVSAWPGPPPRYRWPKWSAFSERSDSGHARRRSRAPVGPVKTRASSLSRRSADVTAAMMPYSSAMPEPGPDGAEFTDSLCTSSCTRGAHQDCPHISAAGGGFNPRRFRFESGSELCPCACHASCPVVLTAKRFTVSMTTWDTSCTCPGAQQERRRLAQAGIEISEFAETREDTDNLPRTLARLARAAMKSRKYLA